MFFFAAGAVKTRLKSYRDMFRRALKQMPSGSSFDLDALTSPRREIIKRCWFLKDHLQSRETVSTLPETQDQEETVCI